MLERLKEAGYPLAVVTSKRHEVAMRGIDRFDLDQYFDFLVGSDDWPEHKPHPGPVAHGCERLGFDARTCLYVGDSPFDMQAGNGAGCATAAALWGMFPQAVLEAEHPTFVCADGTEIPRPPRSRRRDRLSTCERVFTVKHSFVFRPTARHPPPPRLRTCRLSIAVPRPKTRAWQPTPFPSSAARWLSRGSFPLPAA